MTQARALKPLRVVAAALVNSAQEVLLAQRPQGKRLAGKWEFPGGKIEEGESDAQALLRELREELGIEVSAAHIHAFAALSHPYPEYDFQLEMGLFLIRQWQGTPQPLEHAALTWCHPRDMHKLDMIEADVGLVERLKAELG